MSLGQRLHEARQKVGLSLETVSRQTDIGTSSLSDFENDKREPKLSILSRLAALYLRPVAYFLEEEELAPAEPVVLWRQRPESGAEAIERRFLLFCEQYRNLEIWCDEVLVPDLPPVSRSRDSLTWSDVDKLAFDVRRWLNLGDAPAFTLRRSLEDRCGIKVFHDAFEPSGTAACVKSDTHGWAILLNVKNSPVRRHYDLAHELFHLLTWGIYRTHDEASSSSIPEEENFANAFASSLLLPEEILRKAIERYRCDPDKLPDMVIPEIARQFGVSVDALLWRICFLYQWERSSIKARIARVKDMAGAIDRSVEDEPCKYPERYRSLAIQALNQGEISLGKFAQYLDIGRQEANKYRSEGHAFAGLQTTAA